MGKKRGRKKAKLRRTQNDHFINESLSINNVANAEKPNPSGRLPKMFHKPLLQEVGAEAVNEEEEDDDNKITSHQKVKDCAISFSPDKKSVAEEDMGQSYLMLPYDFWELLSNYVLPEDLGSFARICRDSYRAVNRSGFWNKLYCDLYKPVAGLPVIYQPQRIADHPEKLR